MSRRPLQILEIDVPYCSLTYGAAFEAGMTPTLEFTQDDLIDADDLTKDADFFWAVDVTVPASPDGIIWEVGGSATGLLFGFDGAGSLIYRAGDGGDPIGGDGVEIEVAEGPFVGKNLRFFGSVNVSANSISLWYQESVANPPTLVATETAASGFTDWAGGGAGGVGYAAASTAGPLTATFNGTITSLRLYDDTSAPPAPTVAGCDAVLGTTGPRKCFQMYGTSVQRRFKQGGCQDPENFTPGTKTLRFSHAVNGLPKLVGPIYPAMRGPISGSALEINIGGVDDKKGPLGRRETLKVPMKDFEDNDSDLDKYQAERVSGAAQADGVGYLPATRGTFFGRLLARWPYWEGASARLLDGYVGDELEDFVTRHFVIHSITGPDYASNVDLELYDVLDLVSRKRMIPVPNNGELPVDIEEDYLGDFTLEATGLGNAEYATSGRICIGNEVMTFTRSGDTFTITARGLDGTEVDNHSRGDTVQQCWRCENATLDEVEVEVLEDYAGVPSTLIPASEWEDEVSTWLPALRLTRTIPKPRDVLDVTASLQRLGVFIWWNSEEQLIGLRANRPVSITETPAEFDMDVDFLEGSIRKVELPEQRYTDVLFWHGLIDPTKSPTDPENYNRVLNVADTDAVSDNAHGASGRRFLNIFCPWLGEGDAISATAISARLVYRFNRTPQKITGMLDRKRVDDLKVAAPVTLTSRLIQFDDGSSVDARMQIIKAQKMQGERVEAVFQSYEFDGRFGVITENDRPDYGASSEAQILVGSYFVDGTTEEFPDGTGPYVFF